MVHRFSCSPEHPDQEESCTISFDWDGVPMPISNVTATVTDFPEENDTVIGFSRSEASDSYTVPDGCLYFVVTDNTNPKLSEALTVTTGGD